MLSEEEIKEFVEKTDELDNRQQRALGWEIFNRGDRRILIELLKKYSKMEYPFPFTPETCIMSSVSELKSGGVNVYMQPKNDEDRVICIKFDKDDKIIKTEIYPRFTPIERIKMLMGKNPFGEGEQK